VLAFDFAKVLLLARHSAGVRRVFALICSVLQSNPDHAGEDPPSHQEIEGESLASLLIDFQIL